MAGASASLSTTPLCALWQHPPYFHDGSAPNLGAVVEHYNKLFDLKLNKAQKADLVEYLNSLQRFLTWAGFCAPESGAASPRSCQALRRKDAGLRAGSRRRNVRREG